MKGKRVEKAHDDGQKDKGEQQNEGKEEGEDDEEQHRLEEKLANKIEEMKLIKLRERPRLWGPLGCGEGEKEMCMALHCSIA